MHECYLLPWKRLTQPIKALRVIYSFYLLDSFISSWLCCYPKLLLVGVDLLCSFMFLVFCKQGVRLIVDYPLPHLVFERLRGTLVQRLRVISRLFLFVIVKEFRPHHQIGIVGAKSRIFICYPIADSSF